MVRRTQGILVESVVSTNRTDLLAQEHKCPVASEGKGLDPLFRPVSLDKDVGPVFVWKGGGL